MHNLLITTINDYNVICNVFMQWLNNEEVSMNIDNAKYLVFFFITNKKINIT
jgi:hypothetical protein